MADTIHDPEPKAVLTNSSKEPFEVSTNCNAASNLSVRRPPPEPSVSVVLIRTSSQPAPSGRGTAARTRARAYKRGGGSAHTRACVSENRFGDSSTNRPHWTASRAGPVELTPGASRLQSHHARDRLWSVSTPRPSLRASRGERRPLLYFRARPSLFRASPRGLCPRSGTAPRYRYRFAGFRGRWRPIPRRGLGGVPGVPAS